MKMRGKTKIGHARPRCCLRWPVSSSVLEVVLAVVVLVATVFVIIVPISSSSSISIAVVVLLSLLSMSLNCCLQCCSVIGKLGQQTNKATTSRPKLFIPFLLSFIKLMEFKLELSTKRQVSSDLSEKQRNRSKG